MHYVDNSDCGRRRCGRGRVRFSPIVSSTPIRPRPMPESNHTTELRTSTPRSSRSRPACSMSVTATQLLEASARGREAAVSCMEGRRGSRPSSRGCRSKLDGDPVRSALCGKSTRMPELRPTRPGSRGRLESCARWPVRKMAGVAAVGFDLRSPIRNILTCLRVVVSGIYSRTRRRATVSSLECRRCRQWERFVRPIRRRRGT